MDATPVATVSPNPGEITLEVQALAERFAKFARFKALKNQLPELTREYEALELELFAVCTCVGKLGWTRDAAGQPVCPYCGRLIRLRPR